MYVKAFITGAAMLLSHSHVAEAAPRPRSTVTLTVEDLDTTYITPGFEEIKIDVDSAVVDQWKNDPDLLSKRGLGRRSPHIYNGFDNNLDTDKQKVSQLEQGQKDAVAMSVLVYDNVDTDGTYDHWFASGDKDKVKEVYDNIWFNKDQNDDDTGSQFLGLVIWKADDFGSKCTKPGDEKDGQGITLAYQAEGTIKLPGSNDRVGVSVNHMCEQGYKFPATGDVKCADLGDTVSAKMSVIGGIMLHEYTHFSKIAAPLGDKTQDIAYGPIASRALSDSDKLKNADNYRWYMLEQYWHITCVKDFSGARDERDTEEEECEPGLCAIQ